MIKIIVVLVFVAVILVVWQRAIAVVGAFVVKLLLMLLMLVCIAAGLLQFLFIANDRVAGGFQSWFLLGGITAVVFLIAHVSRKLEQDRRRQEKEKLKRLEAERHKKEQELLVQQQMDTAKYSMLQRLKRIFS